MADTPSPAAPRRVIGRILSLGIPLPGIRVDNYNFLRAPSFFDYDALVVDIGATSALIDDVIAGTAEVRTLADILVLNAPQASGNLALADILQRRQGETARLLANDGVIICFIQPPRRHEPHGMPDGWRDDAWLGATAPAITHGEGSHVEVCDWGHELAPFIHAQAANIAYRAYADESTPGLRVIARSYGGAAVAFEIPVDQGRVVFLPALRVLPSGQARYTLSDTLQSGIRNMLGVMAEGHPPSWIRSFAVPGLAERETGLTQAQDRLRAAERDAHAAAESRDELARYHRLLWQEGSAGLEAVVVDALRLLGCDVYDRDPHWLEARIAGQQVIVETAASEGEIDMAPHYRLRDRIEQTVAKRGGTARAFLFVNGHRLTNPDERPDAASPALQAAAATMRYAIIPTRLLFDAVVAKLNGDEVAVEAFRARLVAETGLLA
jgi:hypothetical protein